MILSLINSNDGSFTVSLFGLSQVVYLCGTHIVNRPFGSDESLVSRLLKRFEQAPYWLTALISFGVFLGGSLWLQWRTSYRRRYRLSITMRWGLIG